MMLPYLEQTAIYNAINFMWAGGGSGYYPALAVNRTATNARIAAFLCPSDGEAGKRNSNSYYGSVGTSVYTGWGGPGWMRDTTGVFAKYMSNGVRDIIDGTSNTVAFSEGLTGGATQDNSRRNIRRNGVTGVSINSSFTNYPQGYDSSANIPMLMQSLQVCTQSWQSGSNISQTPGAYWGWGDTGMTLFQTIVPPNSTQYQWHTCRSGCGGCSVDSSVFVNATSNHAGGCEVLFADGGVRFVKATTNMATWMQIGTKANGEVVSSNQYQ